MPQTLGVHGVPRRWKKIKYSGKNFVPLWEGHKFSDKPVKHPNKNPSPYCWEPAGPGR